MSSSCRVCAKVISASNLTLNLFCKSSRNIKILIRLKKIVGIEIKQKKDMPDYICADCILRLEQAFQFRLECRRAQTLLRKSLLQKAKRTNRCKQTIGDVELKSLTTSPTISTEFNDVVYPEVKLHENAAPTVDPFESVKIKTETDIATNYNLRHKESSELVINEACIPFKINEISDDDENRSLKTFDACLTSSETSDDNWSPDFNEENLKPSNKRKKSVITQNTSTITTDSSELATTKNGNRKCERRKTKKIIACKTTPENNLSSDEKIAKYICEMCGQTFNVMHYFQSHVNRHKGEQTFACEICPEKYYTQQSLKRHILKHAGAQPNACRFCPRRFLDCSAKVRHERMHTNDRPYKCTYCGKAFTSNYVLKNHVLTHTGERPFSCKICQRSFIQKKHLATHYKSTTHKQNAEKANEVC